MGIEMKISIFLPIFCLVLLGYLADARPGKHRKGSGSGSKSTSSRESGSGSKSGSCSCADSSETVPAAPALPIRLSKFDRSQVADRKKKKEKKQKKGKKGKKGSGSCSCEDDGNELPATVIGVITAAPTPIRLWG